MRFGIIAIMLMVVLTACTATTQEAGKPGTEITNKMPEGACTREYMPVCGINGITYGNKCMAGTMEIAYDGECVDETAAGGGEGAAGGTFPTGMTSEEICTSNLGTWLADFNECEYIGENVCQEMGGTFNECASACRNDLTTEVCTMQCVAVCKIG